ncbi:MAG: F0F1 ATP synthase subunit epsilon [Desulfovibrio sp.]|jgi:F-type H+-transporting ATPase subunit epsilon|nr:F0F1 ATP synthase subunit epsilon [Desulfovibrio sp.]
MGTLRLEVVTPDKTVFGAEVEMAVCPGVGGEFGVLANHISLLSALKVGALRYRASGGKDEYVFISGGFADMNNNVLTVLAESAELAGNIDAARAQRALERAEKRLAARDDAVDVARAESALQRAVMRLSVAVRH